MPCEISLSPWVWLGWNGVRTCSLTVWHSKLGSEGGRGLNQTPCVPFCPPHSIGLLPYPSPAMLPDLSIHRRALRVERLTVGAAGEALARCGMDRLPTLYLKIKVANRLHTARPTPPFSKASPKPAPRFMPGIRSTSVTEPFVVIFF